MNVYEEIKSKKGYISALSPMDGITDSVFRQVLCDIGKPDIFFTEFLNVEGFCSKGRKNIVHRIQFSEIERPIVIQLWGNIPEYYVEAIGDIKELKPDGIDINMGCSVRDVISGGRGSALIKDRVLAKEIISAVKDSAGDIPVSVKTRIGFDSIDTENWIGFLLEQKLDLITVHGRLSKEDYSTPSRWDEIGKCVILRDSICPSTMILGNGDVRSIFDGLNYVSQYNLDGFLIGRASMSNPWIFSERVNISKEERINVLLKHLDLFKRTWNGSKPFSSQKKYVKAYLNDFDGVNDLRKELLLTEDIDEMREILKKSY